VPAAAHDGYLPIGDYALLSNCHNLALISSAGSIDWATFHRFEWPSVFGRLLDRHRGGHFTLTALDAPDGERSYLPGTMVLERRVRGEHGQAVIVECIPIFQDSPDASFLDHHRVLRIVRGEAGSVDVEVRCAPRFEYGLAVPLVSQIDEHRGDAIGGAAAITLQTSFPLEAHEHERELVGRATVRAGETAWVVLDWRPAEESPHRPETLDRIEAQLAHTTQWWRTWLAPTRYRGRYRREVERSALVLKSLTHFSTGGIAAAATTSLPEEVGGERNWDYRYTWIRDATYTLIALGAVGQTREARDFARWLARTTAGRAKDIQIMYAVDGARRIPEFELGEVSGYRNSRPVRIGNGAWTQTQHDVYGELLDAMYRQAVNGVPLEASPEYVQALVSEAIRASARPDHGMWESRGEPLHYTQSKVMCWLAIDRGMRIARSLGWEDAPIDLWWQEHERLRREIWERGTSRRGGHFVQAYGSERLDASLLLLPIVGFVDASDPTMVATTAAIESELSVDGLLYRYRGLDDGLEGGEGTFIICTLWMVQNLVRQGRILEAQSRFERVLELANDVGLFSEEAVAETGEMLGNFPQAFTHIGVILSALELDRALNRARV
jgi:GH15 family glucan-1,4-alpha-glucosidase